MNEDYSAIEEVVNLDESNRRMCFNITVTDDIRAEPLESFIVELKRIPSLTAHTVRFSPNVSVIEIQDDGRTSFIIFKPKKRLLAFEVVKTYKG